MIRILLVEDDQDLGNLLQRYLEVNQFEVQRVYDGIEARNLLQSMEFDILILDVMMPNEDGFTLAQKLKNQFPQIPFLFVTARKMKEDVLKGLKLGADDYMTKPFDADELILRIQNILKRNQIPSRKNFQQTYTIGQFEFVPNEFSLKSAKTSKILTEKETQLLEYLYLHKERIIRREEILNHLWEESDFFTGRSLDVFISRLRKYFSDDPSIQIESVRGVGFRFLIGEI